MSLTLQTMELLAVSTAPILITMNQLLVEFYSETPVFIKLELVTLALCALYMTICASTIKATNDEDDQEENEVSHKGSYERNRTLEDSGPNREYNTWHSSLTWRKSKDQGHWCTLLLPFVRITNGLNNKSVLNTLHLSFMNNVLLCRILSHFDVPALSFMSFGLFTLLQQQGIWFGLSTMEILLAFSVFAVFQYCIARLPQLLPLSFTFGENEIITQSAAIYVLSIIHRLSKFDQTSFTIHGLSNEDQEIFFFTNFALIGGATVVITCYWIRDWLKKFTIIFYPVLFTLIAIVTILLGYLLQQNSVIWLLKYLTTETHRQQLFLYWGMCSAVSAIIAVLCYHLAKNKGSTIIRKYFHILAIIVFTPGIIADSKMLSVATSCVLVVVVVLECIRIIRVWPFGDAIHNAFQVFVDEKDGGIVILTHIYLLIGCAAPLWLSQELNSEPSIELFSGIISIGIGDTSASVFGSKFGKTKWRNSKKSVEGTIAAIVLQGMFVIILFKSGWISFGSAKTFDDTLLPRLSYDKLWIWRYFLVAIGIVCTSFLEAFTSQIDNLVLPIFMYIIFRNI